MAQDAETPNLKEGRRWIRQPLLLSILAGALYALAFPVVQASPLAWFALIPLIWAVRAARTWRRALLYGATAAVAMCAIGYAWIADMAMRFWSVPLPVAALLLLLYSSFGEINFTLFALFLHRLRRRLERWPAAATAALFTLIEALVPKIFPDTLGSTQVNVPGLPAAASLVGTFGLSFVVAWFGACLAWIPGSGVRRRQRLGELVLCLVCVGGIWMYGARRLQAVDALPVQHQLDVAIVQSNIGDMGVFLDELGDMRVMADTVIAQYMKLTREAVEPGKPDVVIWPETAIPITPRDRAFEPVRALVRELDVPLAFGGYEFLTLDTGIWRIHNTLYWMDRHGLIRERYYKHNLLPLGEHVPFSDRFPFLLDWIPDAGGILSWPRGSIAACGRPPVHPAHLLRDLVPALRTAGPAPGRRRPPEPDERLLVRALRGAAAAPVAGADAGLRIGPPHRASHQHGILGADRREWSYRGTDRSLATRDLAGYPGDPGSAEHALPSRRGLDGAVAGVRCLWARRTPVEARALKRVVLARTVLELRG